MKKGREEKRREEKRREEKRRWEDTQKRNTRGSKIYPPSPVLKLAYHNSPPRFSSILS